MKMNLEEKLDLYIDSMDLNERNVLSKYIEPLKKLSPRQVRKKLKSAFDQFVEKMSQYPELEDQILKLINSKLGANFRSLKDAQKKKVQEGYEINEDFSHFWGWFKDSLWPAVTIFPTLQVWFQIDKLLEGAGIEDLNFKKIAVYALLWLTLVTGKHIKMWKKWKEEEPEEFEKEGRPGPFTPRKS